MSFHRIVKHSCTWAFKWEAKVRCNWVSYSKNVMPVQSLSAYCLLIFRAPISTNSYSIFAMIGRPQLLMPCF